MNEKVKKFLKSKFILLIALIPAILALLMVRGIIPVEKSVTNGFTVAAAIGIILYLMKESMVHKYHRYAKKWGMGPYAEDEGLLQDKNTQTEKNCDNKEDLS